MGRTDRGASASPAISPPGRSRLSGAARYFFVPLIDPVIATPVGWLGVA
jgi:hypothetical protein